MRYDTTRNQYIADQVGGDTPRLMTTNGAISVADGRVALAKTSAGAYTLLPPGAGDEGMRLLITSRTAFAHTVTIAEGIGGKGGSFDVITFNAIGDSIELMADNGHWVPTGAPYGATIG